MNIFRRIIGRGTEFALLLAATIIITVVMLNLYTAQGIKLNSDIGWVIGGFIGVFTIAHLTLCFLAPQADQFMLPVAALVNGLGLAMIHRIDLAEDTHLVSRQVMWMVVGIGLLITVLVFLRDHRSLQRYSYVLGAIGRSKNLFGPYVNKAGQRLLDKRSCSRKYKTYNYCNYYREKNFLKL